MDVHRALTWGTREEVYEREMARLRAKQRSSSGATAANDSRRSGGFSTPKRSAAPARLTVDNDADLLPAPVSPVGNPPRRRVADAGAPIDRMDGAFYSPMSTPRPGTDGGGDGAIGRDSPLSLSFDVDGVGGGPVELPHSLPFQAQDISSIPMSVARSTVVRTASRTGSSGNSVASTSTAGRARLRSSAASVGASSHGTRVSRATATSTATATQARKPLAAVSLQQANAFFEKQTEWLKMKREHEGRMQQQYEAALHKGIRKPSTTHVKDPEAHFANEMEAQRRKQERCVCELVDALYLGTAW